MTQESATFVVVSKDSWESVGMQYARVAESSTRKHHKAPPGNRQALLQFDTACGQIELLAMRGWAGGALSVQLSPEQTDLLDRAARSGENIESYPWRQSLTDIPTELRPLFSPVLSELELGSVLVEIRNPFIPSAREESRAASGSGVVPPAQPWRASEGAVGLRAVGERWNRQLQAALDGTRDPIVPSGVSNNVMTEGLRRFVGAQEGRPSVKARVVYRDGSEARPFTLGRLPVADREIESVPTLRLALLSLRHPEMDVDVDGAWLRNRETSQVRPQAETDEMVYVTSMEQFATLLRNGPRNLYLYQTGLEPAIVGFYRALTDHLLAHPESVAVVPHFYRSGKSFTRGTPWASR